MPGEILLTARAESRQGAKATLGKPIVLIVTTKNVTDERWSLYRTNFLLDYGIEVRDGDGHKVGLTEEGVRRYERAGAYYSREGVNLPPRGSFDERFDISGLYDLKSGGAYRIKLRRRIVGLGEEEEAAAEVTSNTINIRL